MVMVTHKAIPAVSLTCARTGVAARGDERGMRPMQARAFAMRGEQYLLIKSPPASGKSRALMFIALDKLHNQGLRKAIIIVPERAIGASFADAPLSQAGFWADWVVAPQWNLCNAPGGDEGSARGSRVEAVRLFLEAAERVLVCTHATFRFAAEALGIAAFDGCLLAVDEFHHASADDDNRLGTLVSELIARDQAHVVAMTGSYFRGDAAPVLRPADEARFATVTYTYYEQLHGYEHLKALDIGYYFYAGSYLDSIHKVLDSSLKTIVHIPNVNARESTADKIREANEIMGALGTWQGEEAATGFHLIEGADGRLLRVADLVDDEPSRRNRVMAALKDPAGRGQRDHVDIIIALGMAKEGFDWIWCEHALTVGYRASLTEVVQIIGRATRDAPGKVRARFTNLIAEPDASQEAVVEALNDTLKAIAASLLMEQVLAPRFNFTPKGAGPRPGFDYGEGGYQPDKANIGHCPETGACHLEIRGLAMPSSREAQRICAEDMNELLATFVQDPVTLGRGLFDHEMVPQDLTQLRMGKIVRDRYPDQSEADQEAIRQHAVAALVLTQKARPEMAGEMVGEARNEARNADTSNGENVLRANTDFVDGIRRYALEVRELDIDLIDSINPFASAYAVLSRALDEGLLRQVEEEIAGRKIAISHDDARALAMRARAFQKERGRPPALAAADPWERRMAEGVLALRRHARQKAREQTRAEEATAHV